MRRKWIYTGVIVTAALIFVIFAIQNLSLISPQSSDEPDNVDAAIRQLVETKRGGGEVESFAESHGLYIKDGLVRVVIELHKPDIEIPSDYSLTIEAEHGRFIQALVLIDEVYDIASNPQVKYIHTPKEPVIAS